VSDSSTGGILSNLKPNTTYVFIIYSIVQLSSDEGKWFESDKYVNSTRTKVEINPNPNETSSGEWKRIHKQIQILSFKFSTNHNLRQNKTTKQKLIRYRNIT